MYIDIEIRTASESIPGNLKKSETTLKMEASTRNRAVWAKDNHRGRIKSKPVLQITMTRCEVSAEVHYTRGTTVELFKYFAVSKDQNFIWEFIRTLRLNRSTIAMNITLAVICVIETRIDESFSDRYDPVSLNMYVIKAIKTSAPLMYAKNVIATASARDFLAWGVPTNEAKKKQAQIKYPEQQSAMRQHIYRNPWMLMVNRGHIHDHPWKSLVSSHYHLLLNFCVRLMESDRS